MFLDSFFTLLFGWSVTLDPLFGMIFISFVLTLLITLAYKYFTDQHLLKSIKERTKALQVELKKFKDNPEKLKEKNAELMEIQLKMMTQTLKPMLITLLPLLLVFSWLRTIYTPLGPVLFGLGWIWAYLIFSVIFSLLLRKLLQVH